MPIAPSETSILNSLGLTAEEYKEKYGEDMDLSEKHLAWFTSKENLEKGKTYYFRVRYTDGKNVKTKWSKTVKLTKKK